MGFLVPAIVVLIGVAIAVRAPLFITVALFVGGLYLSSRLWVRWAAGRLAVERQFEPRAFCGEEAAVTVTVRNTGVLPIPWLEAEESVPVELRSGAVPSEAFYLAPRGRRRMTYTLTCRRRGHHPLGPMRVETGDIFGIDEQVLTLGAESFLTVYPRIVPLQRLGLPTRSALVTVAARTPLFEDPSRVIGVREYYPGDSPRRIHWTASAHAGSLLVKQYQPAINRETLLCLDLGLSSYPMRRHEASETAIITAALLARHCIVNESLPVGLATDARIAQGQDAQRIGLRPRSGQAQLITILETLALVNLAPSMSLPELLRQESVNLSWGATIVVITGRLNDELAVMLHYLRRQGYAVAAILVHPRYPRPMETDSVSLGAVPVHRVWSDADLAGLA